MSSGMFECNGYTFRLNPRLRAWKLYFWQGDRWVSLSAWRTRKEALTAAECFVPAALRDQP